MRLRFTKMHGLGNDFVMLDGVSQKINLSPERIQKIADRNFGIGCDQVLLVEAPREEDCDFRYRIFNQDGSEVQNCGNGARCFAHFVRQRGLTSKDVIKVQTSGGKMVLHIIDEDLVRVDMGVPILEPADIPFSQSPRNVNYTLDVAGTPYDISAVSMGNPHAVTLVENVDTFPVESVGPLVERHKDFPERVNAGFLELISRKEGRLRVFERGVGETIACGTGACAAMVTGVLRGHFDSDVTLHLRGGSLKIQWEGEGHHVLMTGPATTVFQGQIKI